MRSVFGMGPEGCFVSSRLVQWEEVGKVLMSRNEQK